MNPGGMKSKTDVGQLIIIPQPHDILVPPPAILSSWSALSSLPLLEPIRSAAFSGVTEPEATALRRESSAAVAMMKYSEFECASAQLYDKPADVEPPILMICYVLKGSQR